MTRLQPWRYWIVCGLFFVFLAESRLIHSFAQNQAEETPAASVDSLFADEAEVGMSLADLLMAGGWVMAVIGALSILAMTLAIYYFFAFTERKLIPQSLVTQILHYARDHRIDEIARLCRRSNGMFAKVILAGATRATLDPDGAASAMEAAGRREGENLMRRARYLSDIAAIAPMLGLLGTVLGMIQAFNFIAFDISAVRPIAMASAVAQALVTTAAGLIVAIPSMGLFFYFRGKLEAHIGRMEEVCVEVAEQINRAEVDGKSSRKTAQLKHPRGKNPRPPVEP